MDKEEFIQDYIANRLSDEENKRAENLLETDAEFQELYATHQEMNAAFALSNQKALKKHFQDLEAGNEVESATTETSRNTTGIFRKLAIAAILIVGAFFAINQFTAKDDLFSTYFEVCANTYLPVTRGTSDQNQEFEAFKAYENGDFEQATILFSDLIANKKDTTIQFYYAMSLLNQEEYSSALAQLQNLITTDFDYKTEALWYAALIELRNENSATAKKYLQQIQTQQPNYKKEAIATILKDL